MILNIFDFAETPVREIMTPRVDMTSLEQGTSLDEVIRHLNKERHSRIPVYRETIDNVVGILHNRDFLHWYTERGEEPFVLQSLLKPPFFVPYHKKIDDLLRELRRAGSQLAIVVDEFGGTAGIVTIEDILEEIVGEIRDEDDFDEEHPIQKLKNNKFLVNPIISLGDLEDELEIPIEVPEDSHVETLGGLIQATLGSLPQVGTEVKIGTFRVKILKLDGVRMEKVLLTLPERPAKKKGR
jgi:CBS domain containing-hemolysin-like protein